jgi:hypothetical protein
MGDFQAFAHSFVIWMPFIVVAPCLWIWAALIRGELHNPDDETIRRDQRASSRQQSF